MRIEITQTKTDEWRFHVVTRNGKTLCASGPYRSRRNAREAARLLTATAYFADIMEVP